MYLLQWSCKSSFARRHMKADQFHIHKRGNVITNIGFGNQCWICILREEESLELNHKFIIFNISE